MKTIISIPLIILILFSGISVKFATHFCGGKIAGSKISISGKLASCGMEDDHKGNSLPIFGTQLSQHCCDDVVTYLGIDTDFTPSFYTVPEYYRVNVKILNVPAGFPLDSSVALSTFCTDASPPCALKFTSVDLSDICVFRI
ncbi:MAG: hypothetical protein MUO72_13985 [Bacteroidales bacterium]|nr:hypothetical protein [Bacteroidales bacterium]